MSNASFTGTDIISIVIVLFLILLAAIVVAGLEALSHSTQIKVDAHLLKSPKRAAKLADLVNDSANTRNSLRFVSLTSQLVETMLVTYLVTRFFNLPWSALLLAVNILLLVVLTETVPRSLGFSKADQASVALAVPLAALKKFFPIQLFSKALLRLTDILVPGRALRYASFDTPEELIALADAAVEDDILEPQERDLIESIIEFGDTIVREVMVPRTDMVAVDKTLSASAALELASEAGFSRLPVVGESNDDVVGLVYVKDLIKAEIDDSGDQFVSDLLRKAKFIPETKKVSELLKEMQKDKFHMAVAVDEYGGIAGIVTLEDLIEEIVGEIVDEYDTEEPLVERLRDGTFRVDAKISIDELNDITGMALPEGAWDTVGGLVFDEFGRVPTVGESCEVSGHSLKIERVQGRRISRVKIFALPVEEVVNE